MQVFRCSKLRWLYVLALAQLVGGPLVLLQVTVFCKMALHEAPRVGMAKAAGSAWRSHDFQAVLATADIVKSEKRKSEPAPDGPKLKLDKLKSPAIPWQGDPLVLQEISIAVEKADCARFWTPAWPQAPPGPPPRVG